MEWNGIHCIVLVYNTWPSAIRSYIEATILAQERLQQFSSDLLKICHVDNAPSEHQDNTLIHRQKFLIYSGTESVHTMPMIHGLLCSENENGD